MASASPFLERVRAAVRVRHYCIRTEQAYLYWLRRFINFHQRRHPDTMGAREVAAFLSDMAVRGQIAPAVGVYPDYRIIDAYGMTLRVVRTQDYDYRMMLEQHLCMIGPGAVFRQSAFGVEAVRSPALPLNDDFDAWLRLGLRGPLRRVAAVKASWREHGESTSLTMRNARLAAARIELVQAFFARADLPVEIRALEPQALSAAYYCAATLALHDPAVPGRRYAWRSLCCKQHWPQHILPERRRSLKLMVYLLGLPWTFPLKSVYRRWLEWRGRGAQLDWH